MLRISGSIYIYIYIYISFLSTSTDLFIRAFFFVVFRFCFRRSSSSHEEESLGSDVFSTGANDDAS